MTAPPRPLVLGALALLAACDPGPVDPETAARACEARAREAQGPTGGLTVGASSSDGPFAGLSIGVSSDYLGGRDPLEVYESCVVDRTGALPIRPPSLLR